MPLVPARVRLLVQNAPSDFEADVPTIQSMLTSAVRSMYGRIGGAAHMHSVGLTAVTPDNDNDGESLELLAAQGVRAFILTLHMERDSVSPVRSALTLCGTCNRVRCSFEWMTSVDSSRLTRPGEKDIVADAVAARESRRGRRATELGEEAVAHARVRQKLDSESFVPV